MIEFPDLPKRERQVFEVQPPNLGLYLGRSALEIPDRGMADCKNVRIRDRKISNSNMGYEKHFALSLGNQCLLIDDFVQTSGAAITIFGTKSDLFEYDSVSDEPKYITPRYNTGDASIATSTTTVTGAGGADFTAGTPDNVKAGDFIHFGSATQIDVDAIWYEIASVTDPTHLELVVVLAQGTQTNVAYTVRKIFTVDDSAIWVADVFPDALLGTHSGLAGGDHWIATNGTELVVWDGIATTVVEISTAIGFSCKTLAYYKNMMVYGQVQESGQDKPASIKNSALADPENVTTLEANEYTVLEGVDFLDALVPLGDFLVAYGRGSLAVMQFVSQPVFFAIRTVAPSIGVYGAKMVMNFGDFHEFLSTDQAYRFDGVQLQPFGGQVFDFVLQQADRSRSSKSFVAISEEQLEIYWVIALSDDSGEVVANKSAEMAYVEHYAENVERSPVPFTRRQLPATASGFFVDTNLGRYRDFPGQGYDDLVFRFNDSFFTSQFPIFLMGDEDGYIYKVNTSSQLGDFPTLLSSFTSPTRAIVDGSDKGIIRRVEPFIEKGTAGKQMFVYVRTSDRVAGDLVYSSGESIDIGHGGDRFIPFREAGVYADLQFFSIRPDTLWTMQGYRVTSERAGER